MATVYSCLSGDGFSSTDDTTARRHVADNPGHRVARVTEESGGGTDTDVIEIKENDEDDGGYWTPFGRV